MTIWIDAQLSPAIANWISRNHSIDAIALRDIGLRDAEDVEIFLAAKSANVVVMTKDWGVLDLLDKFGPPPKVLGLTCGNTSNARLKQVLTSTLQEAIRLVEAGERLIEIGDA